MRKVMATFRAAPHASMLGMAPHAEAEADRIYQLYTEGTVKEAYYGDAAAGGDGVIAVVVLEAADQGAAERLVADFPLVRAGMIQPTFVPLKPYTPFGQRLHRAGQPTPAWWPE